MILSNLKREELNSVQEKIVKDGEQVLTRAYTKRRFLGKGGFASVYEFVSGDRTWAAKIIDKTALNKVRARQKLMNEVKIHRSLRHPNVVEFQHFFEDDECVYILLQLCSNGAMNQLLRRRKRLTELEARCYTYQAMCGVQYLHSNSVIHRDIKLANLFLDQDMQLKIGDFGLASRVEFRGEQKRTICGTPNYIAPEILDGKSGHSFPVDIWSLGVLLYTLVVGKPPFETDNLKATYNKIKTNEYSFPSEIGLSESVKDLITRMLVINPAARISLNDALNHEFFATDFPKTMPPSTLAIPPSSNFLSQFRTQPMIKHSHTQKIRHHTQPAIVRTSTAQLSAGLGIVTKAHITAKRVAVSSRVRLRSGQSFVWVQKWIDYSSKYGFGYLLSNNMVGVVFNDSTTIISDQLTFQYFTDARETEAESTHSFANVPDYLRKKVNLLEYFRKHLIKGQPPQRSSCPVYVKRCLKLPEAIFFRLSNKLLQVYFCDRAELLLCTEDDEILFVSSKGAVESRQLDDHSQTHSSELAHRLRYVKDSLTGSAPRISEK